MRGYQRYIWQAAGGRRPLLILIVLLLVAGSMSVQGQGTPPVQTTITIQLASEAEAGDPASGSPVLAPGSDTFYVQIDLTGLVCPEIERTIPVDVVLVVDVSFSMESPTEEGGTVTKLQATQQSAKNFLTHFNLNAGDGARSDQVAIVSFSGDAQVESDFSKDINALNQVIDNLTPRDDTNIAAGLRAATDLLSGPSANFVGKAASVIVVLSDGQSDLADMMREAERARTNVRSRIVVIGLGSDVERANLSQIADNPAADNAFFAVTADELNLVYQAIAERIIPRVAASEMGITYTLDPTRFEIIPDSQNPTNGVITLPATVSWTYSELLSGTTEQFSFLARARQTGSSMNVGDVNVSYLPCIETENPVTTTATGPQVSVISPSATPTPTSTPTPTVTPTPTNTATSTPASMFAPPPDETYGGRGIDAGFCAWGVWDWIPLLIFLLALLLALWFIYRLWRDEIRSTPRDWACFLLTSGAAVAAALTMFFFAQPLVMAVCPLPESVYFWRVGEDKAGIFLTHQDARSDDPAAVEFVNAEGCVGCHSISRDGTAISAIIGPVPGGVVGFSLDGERLAVPGVEAVFSALSPDGTKIAITNGNGDLMVADINTGATIALTGATDSQFAAIMPAWSPDGQAIAYTRVRRDRLDHGLAAVGESDLYLVPAAGGTAAPIPGASNNGWLNYYPAFSPDGRWLAFTAHDNVSTFMDDAADLYLLDMTTGTARPIEGNSPSASDSRPTWNSTGTKIAFSSNRYDTSYDVVIVDVFDNGVTSNTAARLRGASHQGVLEHMPQWGKPEARPALLAAWLGLLPLAFPALLLALLAILCRLFKSRPEEAPPPIPAAIPPREPALPQALPPLPVVARWDPQPALVIGLGRAGWNVVAQLKKNIYEAGSGKPNPKVRLFSVIGGAQKEQTEERLFSGLYLDEQKEVVRWQDSLQNIVGGARDDADDALRGWVDELYLRRRGETILDPREGLRQFRILGRVAYINNARGNDVDTGKNFLRELAIAARETLAAQPNKSLDVIIVADTSDEVGSGIMMDVAYAARRLQELLQLRSPVRIVGHMVTHDITDLSSGQSTTRRVNTGATLRELERFQMAVGAPFPMKYGSQPNQPVTMDDGQGQQITLDGMMEKRLFDEFYLHDGQRKAGIERQPEIGVYPALADSIMTWLDTPAREGNIREWRSGKESRALNFQELDKRLMVGGLGVYQYRLPLADLLDDITTRFARKVLQTLLMAASDTTPNWNAALVVEEMGSRGKTAQQVAESFLAEEMGSPEGLDDSWRRFFRLYVSRTAGKDTDTQRKKAIDGLRASDDNAAAWEKWLQHLLALILNGDSNGRYKTQPVSLRGAKLSLARDVLNVLSGENGLLGRAASLITVQRGTDDVVAQIRRFMEMARAAMTEVEQAGRALGIQAEQESLYVKIEERERSFDKLWDARKNLATRAYITELDGQPFRKTWYEKYRLDDRIGSAVQQFHWRVEKDPVSGALKPALLLRFYDSKADLVFDPQQPDVFIQQVLALGRYFADDALRDESLAAVLRADVFRPDRLSTTATALYELSEPLLGVNTDKAVRTERSMVICAHRSLEREVRDLQRALQTQYGIDNEHMSWMETTDPFSLSIVQTVDVVALNGVNSLTQVWQQYDSENGLGRQAYREDAGARTAAFEAEYHALRYERAMSKVRSQPHRLHPVVVTALASPLQTRAYLLIAADGTEWQYSQNAGLHVTAPELGTAQLILRDGKTPVYGVLMDGLLQFNQQVDEAAAERMTRRYLNDAGRLDRLTAWYEEFDATIENGITPWQKLPAPQNAADIVRDLELLAAILIYDELGGEDG